MPDNGADEQVVEPCVVDDFHFFPLYLPGNPLAAHLKFHAEVLTAAARGHALQMCVRKFSVSSCGRPPAA